MATQARFSRWVELSGSEKVLPPGATMAAAIPGDETFEVTVRLRRRKALPPLKGRPQQPLTRAEYASRYGAGSADVAKVEAFAKHFKLQILDVQVGERSVILCGSVAQFAQAFHVELRQHALADGSSYRGRVGTISIPAELEGIVVGIFGLDNRPVVRRSARRAAGASRAAVAGAAGAFQTKGPVRAFYANELAKLYHFPVDLDGRGETIGIVELGGGFVQADLDLYFQQAGVAAPPNVTVATVPGGASNAPAPHDPNGPDVEVLLDMEVAGAVAPGARMVMFFAKDGSDQQTLRGILTAIHDAAADVSVISLSWQGTEYDASMGTGADFAVQKQYQDNFNAALETAAHLGITVCIASGDYGSACAPLDDLTQPWDGKAHVSFPASSPFALACGGTHIIAATGGALEEEVWHPSANVGTGGGISRYFKLPDYQRQAVSEHAVNPAGGAGRGVPDVAANAAEESGYRVRVDGHWYPDAEHKFLPIGGTSAATPLWAGLIALLNQGLGTRLGFVNPLLYKLAAETGAFHDVTKGNNGDYKAGPAWDACTGLGTPDGEKLLAALRPLAGGVKRPAVARPAAVAAQPAARGRQAAARRGPAAAPAPRRRAAVPVPRDAQEEARHILTFDSDDASTFSPHSLPEAQLTRRAELAPIPWPSGKQPVPAPLSPAPDPDDPLPQCDYLVVTWTVEEAKALADTLTPGFPSKTAWYHYTHNFDTKFVPIIRRGAPSVEDSHRLGSYFLTSIDGKRVICFKSELHMSQDGPKLPIAALWQQLIAEARPKLVITTGTAGGIGAAVELGDVVVAPQVRFDCQKEFKNAAFHDSIYSTSKLSFEALSETPALVAANVARLPKASRPPAVFTQPIAGVPIADVVTTDFFAFDDATNTYGLQGLGAAVEMGDAVLGMVIGQLGKAKPKWAAIRNASDPQIANAGMTPAAARKLAAQIYERYGYWTTIPSAIACWAIIKAN